MQPTPVFLPGKFHGQRRLVGYNPWGCKEPDTTEHVCALTHRHTHTHTHTHTQNHNFWRDKVNNKDKNRITGRNHKQERI